MAANMFIIINMCLCMCVHRHVCAFAYTHAWGFPQVSKKSVSLELINTI